MIEKYYKYKISYKNYVMFIKSGIFYECIANDALIVNSIFDYKIKMIGNTIKVGFPMKNIKLVLDELRRKNINYIVVDNDQVDKKFEANKNDYLNYKYDIDCVMYNLMRIEKIVKYMEENVMDLELNKKLDKIEMELYK